MDPISVCIAAHQEEATIRAAVRSILDQDYPGTTEVWVCANACTDRTEAVVRSLAREDPRVRLLHTRERGKPNAWNALMERASFNFRVFVDADVVLDRRAVGRLHARLAEGDVMAVGGATHAALGGLDPITRLVADRARTHGCLVGCLYAIDAPEVVAKMEAEGYEAMPRDIINEDVWLTLVLGRGNWTLEPSAIAHFTPLRWFEMPKMQRRRERARHQLRSEYSHLLQGADSLEPEAPLVARGVRKLKSLLGGPERPSAKARNILGYARAVLRSNLRRLAPRNLWHRALRLYAKRALAREEPSADALDGWEIAHTSKRVPEP